MSGCQYLIVSARLLIKISSWKRRTDCYYLEVLLPTIVAKMLSRVLIVGYQIIHNFVSSNNFLSFWDNNTQSLFVTPTSTYSESQNLISHSIEYLLHFLTETWVDFVTFNLYGPQGDVTTYIYIMRHAMRRWCDYMMRHTMSVTLPSVKRLVPMYSLTN